MPTKKTKPSPACSMDPASCPLPTARRKACKLAAAGCLAEALAPAVEPSSGEPPTESAPPPSGKIGILVGLLQRPEGATIAQMATAADWQQRSIRGAMAGALKKRGYAVSSEKPDKERIYRIASPAAGSDGPDALQAGG